MRLAVGAIVVRNSNCLAERSKLIRETPVMLPPGFERDLTKPLPTGLAVGPITIGMDVVACWTADTAGVTLAKITSGRVATSSAARRGSSDKFPSALLTSRMRF